MEFDFIPFGAQYYRAPTPSRENWETDIRHFAEQGFNTLKYWAQWRWNNPKEGVYDFSDLQELMDLAETYHLKVVINVILDVMPAWFYRKYPDSAMVTNNGEILCPQTLPYRQIGGAPGPCYNHPEAIRCKKEFVRALGEAFAHHPALLMWDLWNEPELTCGLKRNPTVPSLVCYCDHCRRAFARHMKKQYGDIEGLNRAWGRNYTDFEEVELPRNPGSFKDMVDFRTFYAHVLRDDLIDRREMIRLSDREHPVMVHTVPMPHFNMISTCCDDYLMAEECDLFGNSVGSEPFPAALAMSSAKGKTVLNAEIHAMGGTTFNRPEEMTYNRLKRTLYTPFAAGIKGFLFWQYRPETIGLESPAWGMTDLEGNTTPCIEYSQKINGIFTKEKDLMTRVHPTTRRIAIIKDNENEIFDWCVDGNKDRAQLSVMGIFQAFYRAGYNVDILTTDQIQRIPLDDYRLIYYPFPYYMHASTADRLKAWVRAGGYLVSEALFGSYSGDNNLHAPVAPGCGFDEVCGARQADVLVASHFRNAYGDEWSEKNVGTNMTHLSVTLGGKHFDLTGHFFEESYDVKPNGRAAGVFDSGKTAAVESDYGKGHALILGSTIGYACYTGYPADTVRFLETVADRAGVERDVQSSADDVRVDILPDESSGRAVLVVCNDSSTADFTVSLAPAFPYTDATDTDDDSHTPIADHRLALHMEPGEIHLYILN